MKIGNFDILLWWGIAAAVCVVCDIALYKWIERRTGCNLHRSALIKELALNIAFAPACLLGWLGAALLWFNEKIRRYD